MFNCLISGHTFLGKKTPLRGSGRGHAYLYIFQSDPNPIQSATARGRRHAARRGPPPPRAAAAAGRRGRGPPPPRGSPRRGPPVPHPPVLCHETRQGHETRQAENRGGCGTAYYSSAATRRVIKKKGREAHGPRATGLRAHNTSRGAHQSMQGPL